MSVNRNRPHVFVLPEDDANRQLADAFHKEVDWSRYRQMQVLPEAGGWENVLTLFNSDYIAAMDRYPCRFMILLIDFDGQQDRLTTAKAAVPDRLVERVFILGVLTEPEALKADLGTYDSIGSALAQDCREETNTIWGRNLLQ